MNHRTRVFLVIFLFFLPIYAAIAFYGTNPKPSQQFIGFGVYSQHGTLSGYTGPNSTVISNQPINWTFKITNMMGSIQFVQILARLGNNQTNPPNATSPSTLPVISNSTLFVPNQNTSLQDFDWRITAVTSSAGLDYLKMDVNGRSMNSTLGNPIGQPFRLFFELWTFDNSLGSFQYYTWLQVGFSVNS